MNLMGASFPKTRDRLPSQPGTGKSGTSRLQTVLLICGILAPLIYVAANTICAMVYKGYSIAGQTVSELSAIGAPTRTLWVVIVSIYNVLMIAFAFGIWLSANQNKLRRKVAVLLLIATAAGFFWPPMHQREVLAAGGSSLTDTLHIVFTVVTVPLMILQILFGALAFGKGFRMYSIISLIILIIAGIITGIEGSKIAKDLPTPWIGIWERINIGAYMLWIIVFATKVLKNQSREQKSEYNFRKR